MIMTIYLFDKIFETIAVKLAPSESFFVNMLGYKGNCPSITYPDRLKRKHAKSRAWIGLSQIRLFLKYLNSLIISLIHQNNIYFFPRFNIYSISFFTITNTLHQYLLQKFYLKNLFFNDVLQIVGDPDQKQP